MFFFFVEFLNHVGSGGFGGGSGGGGGSYNVGKDQQRDCCYNTAGHGLVTITLRQKKKTPASHTATLCSCGLIGYRYFACNYNSCGLTVDNYLF